MTAVQPGSPSHLLLEVGDEVVAMSSNGVILTAATRFGDSGGGAGAGGGESALLAGAGEAEVLTATGDAADDDSDDELAPPPPPSASLNRRKPLPTRTPRICSRTLISYFAPRRGEGTEQSISDLSVQSPAALCFC